MTLLIALAVRLWGIGFGLPLASARPDETQIAGPAVGYLTGNLEPPFFQWPALFQYIVAVAYVVFALVTRPFGGYATLAAFAESRRQSLTVFLLIPRLLVVVLAVVTVWWLFNIGRRRFGAAVGHVAALFLAPLDYYYYFSLMPSAVLIVVLALTSVPRGNVALWIGIALCVGAVAVTPARIRFSRTLHQMPEYGPLVQGSRAAARRGVPMRAVRTEFPLPPTGDPEYLYLLLGGRIERSSRWLAVIAKNGSVTYQDLGGT